MSRPQLSPSDLLLRPGITCGFYPERSPKTENWLQNTAHALAGIIKTVNVSERRCRKIVASIHDYGRKLEKLNDAAFRKEIRNIRIQLHQHGMTNSLTRQAFALVRETAGRTINMRHFDTQLMGGWIMVHGGLAEMETGEGKTLTATLAAATAALAGVPVHIVTVNDYLVTRDSQLMGPVYKAMGLSVSTITVDMDAAARRKAYLCNITYCTNKQLAFDYLRDRILLGNDQGRLRLQLERLHDDNARTDRLFLRGLCFAIIDEADSVLIDEARTPLIISRKSDSTDEEQTYQQAMSIAGELQCGKDFILDLTERRVQLSEKGNKRLKDSANLLGGVWNGARRSEELVCQALSAKLLYLRDHHYFIQDDKVLIIDENTGRVMADRTWEHGLHQMIEIKENCTITGRREHMARLTYQRFFRRYLRLSGMTGTAREVRRELWAVYSLPVVKVSPYKPCIRKEEGQRIFAGKAQKWAAVIKKIKEQTRQDRPVLVGTRSLADSEYLSALLDEKGLPHQILNARQDSREAEIVARAGGKGCITVATNMAGRGTDIPLGAGVAEIGGLHIISTERNEARRIDRQLYGRCGRQGDPGSYETLLSLDDELLQSYLSDSIKRRLARLIQSKRIASQGLGMLVVCRAQSARERQNIRIRRDLLQIDEQLGRLLAFSGRME
jgi:preprotein translocase subunit SecA